MSNNKYAATIRATQSHKRCRKTSLCKCKNPCVVLDQRNSSTMIKYGTKESKRIAQTIPTTSQNNQTLITNEKQEDEKYPKIELLLFIFLKLYTSSRWSNRWKRRNTPCEPIAQISVQSNGEWIPNCGFTIAVRWVYIQVGFLTSLLFYWWLFSHQNDSHSSLIWLFSTWINETQTNLNI